MNGYQLRATLLITRNRYSLSPRDYQDVFDYAQRALDFTLPNSYCEYIKVFGPGTLALEYRIAAPGYPGQNWQTNLLCLNESHSRFIRSLEGVTKGYYSAQRQIVWFCTSGRGDSFGWMPDEIHTVVEDECAVYMLRRSEAEPSLVSETFTSFILDHCLRRIPFDGTFGGDSRHLRFDPDADVEMLR